MIHYCWVGHLLVLELFMELLREVLLMELLKGIMKENAILKEIMKEHQSIDHPASSRPNTLSPRQCI